MFNFVLWGIGPTLLLTAITLLNIFSAKPADVVTVKDALLILGIFLLSSIPCLGWVLGGSVLLVTLSEIGFLAKVNTLLNKEIYRGKNAPKQDKSP